MLDGVLIPLLCLPSRCEPDPGLRRCDFPAGWHSFSGIWISLAKNKYTCGRFKKWINTVFQIKSKSVGRETERELSRPSLFYRSEAPQQAEAHSTKIVFVRRNFSVELSPATYRVRLNKWIVKVGIWQCHQFSKGCFSIAFRVHGLMTNIYKKICCTKCTSFSFRVRYI